MPPDRRLQELWRVFNCHGQSVRAVIVPARGAVTLLWFMDDELQGGEDFPDGKAAAKRADAMRRELLAAAEWRES